MTSFTTSRRRIMHYLIERELTHERQADLLREAAQRRLVRRARRSTRRPIPRKGNEES
jgi:hypothetical protein